MKRKNHSSGLVNPKKPNEKGGQLQGLALEFFKKFDVDLGKIKNEVTVLNFEMVDYEEKNKLSVFGEKESISYKLHFEIYNIEILAKLLTFEYETKSELLKMDISCKTLSVSKEMKYCCNLLRRRRNLNLMFITLITFARYLESRRLIFDLLLEKNKNFKIEENKDGGKIIVYRDEKMILRLGIFWSIECNSDHEIIDKVEIYYKVAELSGKSQIKFILTHLTEPHLQFSEKYHLWKDLLNTLMNQSININDDHRQGISDDNLADISIIKHFQLKTDRIKVKKEEPVDEDDDVTIVSCSHNETNPLVCIKNPKLLSKNTKEATILFNKDDNSQIIYVDSLDEPESSSQAILRNEALEDSTKANNVIELTDIESGVILLHSDAEDNDIGSSKNKKSCICNNTSTQKAARHDQNILYFNSTLPTKKPKIVDDDDLEITGITYMD